MKATDPAAIIEAAAREIGHQWPTIVYLAQSAERSKGALAAVEEVRDFLTPILTRMAEAYHEARAGRVCPDCGNRSLVRIHYARASGCAECLAKECDELTAERDALMKKYNALLQTEVQRLRDEVPLVEDQDGTAIVRAGEGI